MVVVNWNGGSALVECLASLYGSRLLGGAIEVVLVDNASVDGSHVTATRTYPGVRLIENGENRGFASAANQGLRLADGDLSLILNPDVVLAPGTIACLAEFMASHPEAAVVGPKLFNPDGTVQGSARRDPSPWTGLFGRNTLATRIFPNNFLSGRELPGLLHQGAEPLEVDWVSGACLMVRRAAYEAVGLMDERFFLFWEDADWCRRFRRGGWKVYYLPAASGVHHVGVSRARRPIRSLIDFHLSAYYFYRKHYLPSVLHPMTAVLFCGLLANFAIRIVPALAGRR